MSDLQIALIILGAIIIVGVMVYNWLQEKKLQKGISEEFLVSRKDVLVEDFYIDADAFVEREFANVATRTKITEKLNSEPPPVLEPKTVPDTIPLETSQPSTRETSKPAKEAPAHTIKPVATPETEEDIALRLKTQLPGDVHPQIDLTAFLYATRPITCKAFMDVAKNMSADMGVSMMLHGIDEHHQWHPMTQNDPEHTYKQIACSIQLADRSGPVSKHILNKFQFAVENMGLELNAHVEWQGTGDAAQRAIALDEFCVEVDQIVSVHLLQGESLIHGTKFRGIAEASGMVLLDDGKFHYVAEHQSDIVAYTLFSSDNQPFTSEVLRNGVVKAATFQFEIPKVTNSEQVFNQMILVAQKMASSLNARLVDDRQKPLGDLQMQKIRQQLKIIHAKMVARGIMPGSPESFRLFN